MKKIHSVLYIKYKVLSNAYEKTGLVNHSTKAIPFFFRLSSYVFSDFGSVGRKKEKNTKKSGFRLQSSTVCMGKWRFRASGKVATI